jgi:hypothetical protein
VPGDVDVAAGRDGEDARLDRQVFEEHGLDASAGRGGCDPHLVCQPESDVALDLVDEASRGTRVEVGFVLDGDDALDPLGVGPPASELDAPTLAATPVDQPAVASPVDRSTDVPPGVARVRQVVAVPRPPGGGVPDHVQQVRVEFALAKVCPPFERLPVALDYDGVPAPALRAELPGDHDRRVVSERTPGRPRPFRPLTDAKLEGELRPAEPTLARHAVG